jgi:hypothetical protein
MYIHLSIHPYIFCTYIFVVEMGPLKVKQIVIRIQYSFLISFDVTLGPVKIPYNPLPTWLSLPPGVTSFEFYVFFMLLFCIGFVICIQYSFLGIGFLGPRALV